MNLAEPSVPRPSTILVVDDDPTQAKLVQAHLSGAGFRVHSASSVAEALDELPRLHPDLVLSDVLMRDADGFALCKQLRQDPAFASLPVVLVSAYFQHGPDQALATAVGADALVERTPDFARELEAIQRVLRQPLHASAASAATDELYTRCVSDQLNRFLEQTKHAEARYALLFQHALDLLAVITGDGIVLEVNQRCVDIMGVPAAQLVGKHVRDFSPPELGDENYRAFLTHAGIGTGKQVSPVRRADGSTLYMDFTLSRIDNDGHPLFLTIGRDVTDQVAAQQRLEASEAAYRSVVENIPDVVRRTTLEGVTTFLSSNVARVTGFDREALLGRPMSEWSARIHPADRARVEAAYAALREQGTPLDLEYRYYRADDACVWLHERASRGRREQGETIDGLVADCSDRKRLEEQFRQAQRLEAVGLLTGGVAHDFNNVLAAILANAHLLMTSFGPQDPRAEDVREIQKAADRAAGLTRQLLAFARKQVMEPMPLDLNEVVIGMEKMLRKVISEDISLDLELVPGGAPIKADLGQIEQITMNLVVNARDAMPEGGRVTIRTEVTQIDGPRGGMPLPAGPYVVLTIADTGSGMDSDTQRRVFEPFFTTKGQAGTGLGLASTYGIVKQSGGFISLDSELGRGTSFRIFLPFEDRAPQSRGPVASDAAPASAGETVLLVEDDPTLRNALRRVLRELGYAPVVARSGEEALAIAAAHPGTIDAVLTDMVMPGMNGTALVTALRSRRPEISVVFMSGYSEHHALGKVSLSGSHFIQKPFDAAAIGRTLQDVLKSRP